MPESILDRVEGDAVARNGCAGVPLMRRIPKVFADDTWQRFRQPSTLGSGMMPKRYRAAIIVGVSVNLTAMLMTDVARILENLARCEFKDDDEVTLTVARGTKFEKENKGS